MKYLNRINTNYYIILISLILGSSILLILISNKIPIKHELINDSKLCINESNYNISDRFELVYESDYAFNNQILKSEILKYYEDTFNCTLKMNDCRLFFSGGSIRLFQRLNKFEIYLSVESEESCFKKLANHLLEKAISDNGKKYKTRFGTKFSEFIWELENHNFIISIYHKGFFHYDLDKQRIYLKWIKESNDFK
ncbi:hypothetical protein MASR1M45_23680 [Candidatus Kapaibacterium sp.]